MHRTIYRGYIARTVRTGWLMACVMIVGWPNLTFGQRHRALKPTTPKARTVHRKAELLGVQPGYLQVRDREGREWILQLHVKPQNIAVTGTADKNWLRHGMFVRFTAQLNRRGQTVDPVASLTVFTPRPEYGVGIVEESALEAANPARAERSSLAAQGMHVVAGKIVKYKANALTITDGRRTITAKLADETEIVVDLLGDYSMARPGDQVEFRGKYYERGKAIVSKLKIAGATPFGTTEVESAAVNDADKDPARPAIPPTEADQS